MHDIKNSVSLPQFWRSTAALPDAPADDDDAGAVESAMAVAVWIVSDTIYNQMDREQKNYAISIIQRINFIDFDTKYIRTLQLPKEIEPGNELWACETSKWPLKMCE